MNFKTLATLGLVATVGLTGCASVTDTNTFSSESAPSAVTLLQTSLSSTEATFTKDGETEEFTYSTGRRVGGYGYDYREGQVVFMVTYSDGVMAIYNFIDRGFADGGDNKGMIEIHSIFDGEIKDISMAKFEWDGSTLVVTSKNGSVTKLGGFKSRYDESSTEAYKVFQEARQAQERINNETFDEAISRFSNQVCVRAEGLSYISTNNIINNVMNPMIRSGEFQMSSSNWRRWNNMNPRLRSENVTNAMIWDCNNVMQLATQNDLNNNINSAILWGHILNN